MTLLFQLWISNAIIKLLNIIKALILKKRKEEEKNSAIDLANLFSCCHLFSHLAIHAKWAKNGHLIRMHISNFYFLYWIIIILFTAPWSLHNESKIFTRPGVAGYVVQTPIRLMYSVREFELSFAPNLQTTFTPKLYELGTWHLSKCSLPSMCHMSYVTCCVSHVIWHFFLVCIKWCSLSMKGVWSTVPTLSSLPVNNWETEKWMFIPAQICPARDLPRNRYWSPW